MELTEAPPEDAPAAPPLPPAAPANSKAAWIVAGVATAVALIAAMFAVSATMHTDNANNGLNAAGAQFAAFNRPVAGTIQSLKGSSFTVKEQTFNGQSATTKVSTNDKTKYRALVDGKLADLKVGDTVSVVGTTTDSVYTATRITEADAQANVVRGGGPRFGTANVGAPPNGGGGGGPQFFRNGGGDMRIGKITQLEGDTITLSTLDGQTQTVKATPSTVVRISKRISRSNLKVGDRVRVRGAVNGSKVTADLVTKGADDAVVP